MEESKTKAPQLLVHDATDNVGVVVVEGVEGGASLMAVRLDDNSDFRVISNGSVPIGHKIALRDIVAGEDAIKYGQVIGRITENVKKGGHVHVHNLKTNRW